MTPPENADGQSGLSVAPGSAFDVLLNLTEDHRDDGTYDLHAKGADYDRLYNATLSDANRIDALEEQIERWRDSNNRLRAEMEHQAQRAQRLFELAADCIDMIEEYHNCDWDEEPFSPDIDGLRKRLSEPNAQGEPRA